MSRDERFIKGRSKEDFLAELLGTAQPGSPVHEQQKMGIIVRCTEDLEKALNEASNSARRLSEKIYYLNIILTVATTIGAIATALIAYKTFFP